MREHDTVGRIVVEIQGVEQKRKRTVRFSIFRALVEAIIMKSRQKINIVVSVISAVLSRHCFGFKQNKLKKEGKEVVVFTKIDVGRDGEGGGGAKWQSRRGGSLVFVLFLSTNQISTASDFDKLTHTKQFYNALSCIYIHTYIYLFIY